MKGAPTIKSILHFLLVVLFLLLPCLAFAEELKPMTTDPATPSSPHKLGGRGAMAMQFKAGEIIVKFKESIPKDSVRSLLLAEGVSVLDEMDKLGLALLSVPKGRELEKVEELGCYPLVEYAAPNYAFRIADALAVGPYYSLRALDVEPNDPYFPSQWNLSQIEAPAAWDITTGSEKVVIAFVDSGVDLDHTELKDKIWTNPGETPGNGLDDDGNGKVDDVHGWDFVNWHGEPQDDYGHGTFVASIAVAETNNGLGMAGVSWGAEIMPIKVYDEWGVSYHWHTAGGIEYAVDKGAKIINLSWTLMPGIDPQPVQTAINYAHSNGALVVAAAGDTFDSSYKYPAALDHVLSVAATDRDDGHPDFSTYNDKVDVAAPGTDILGVYLGGGYARLTSTHAAAPNVSGLAALVWSVNPQLMPDEVESIIKSTAVDLGEPGEDDYFGYGRIDASAAVMTTTHCLEVEPDESLYFLVCDDGNPPLRKITNPNTSSSTWTVTTAACWLSISSPEGYTPSSATVSVDKGSLLDYGFYTALITATSTMTSYTTNPKTITATAIYTQCWINHLPLLFKN
jgi:subtilisin family serine protease